MEILDFKRFSEKLDIKPADINNIKKITPASMLKAGDVTVMSDGRRYIYLPETSVLKYNYPEKLHLMSLHNVINREHTDILIRCDISTNIVTYRTMSKFGEDLRMKGAFYNVSEIYRHSEFKEPVDNDYIIRAMTGLSGFTLIWKRDTII